MIDLFIRKLRARHNVSKEEESALRSANWISRRFDRLDTMVRSGTQMTHSILLLSGFAFRCKYTADGVRQIVENNIAGDFVDLHGFLLGRLEHDIIAASRCEIATVAHSELKRITDQSPRLARMLWFQTLVDAAIHREWMLVLGKKRSRARVAQLFCEMHARLKLVGLTTGGHFPLPFNQQEMADVTGMTSVHLNRCLKELREGGLATFRAGQVEIHDMPGLVQEAQFDPTYLHTGAHNI